MITNKIATPEEVQEIEHIAAAWCLYKSEDVLNVQILRANQIARKHGLPDLPSGHCYMINSIGQIVS